MFHVYLQRVDFVLDLALLWVWSVDHRCSGNAADSSTDHHSLTRAFLVSVMIGFADLRQVAVLIYASLATGSAKTI